MPYLGMLVVSVIAFYTFLFGLEVKKEKNNTGFFAITALAAAVIILPLYLLFFR